MVTEDAHSYTTNRILVVDDDAMNRRLLKVAFTTEGFDVLTADNGEAALGLLVSNPPSVILLDLRMPGMDGLLTLRHIREQHPQIPVIMLTAYGDIPAAVEAVQLGAYDFLIRPISHDKLVVTVRRAMEREALVAEVQGLRSRLRKGSALARIVGESAVMHQVIEQILQVADTNMAVLIQGETGTGKELVARAIHEESRRRDKPFMAVDCGAVPESLLESEFFGHERGAFSGAVQRRAGHILATEGGTLFLDELANMAPLLQAKLLRVVQERTVQQVGSSRTTPVDFRVVAATNAYLSALIPEGRFRSDLFYRLAEFTIQLPPLRERREDIPLLAHRFADEASSELGVPTRALTDAALERLQQHNWPGNVRELRATIRQAVLRATGPEIDEQTVARSISRPGGTEWGQPPPRELSKPPVPPPQQSLLDRVAAGASLKELVDAATVEVERRAILETLEKTGGNKAQAARLLKVDYKTLFLKIKKLKIP